MSPPPQPPSTPSLAHPRLRPAAPAFVAPLAFRLRTPPVFKRTTTTLPQTSVRPPTPMHPEMTNPTAAGATPSGRQPKPAFDEDAILSALPPSPARAPVHPHAPVSPPERPNLWSVLKDAVGKDLARITLPVYFNEPLSFLQRLAEDVEYSRLLDAAAAASGADRAALVAAFVISHYSSTADRASKPFNPLLGETYDLVIPGRLCLVAEQVAHHPPTSAIHVRGSGWTYHTAHEIRNKFKGNTLEVWPEGAVHVHFDDGEHFVYDQAHTNVHNIILGELWLDNVGTIVIREVSKAAIVATVKMKKTAFLFGEAKKVGELSGRVSIVGKDGKSVKTVRKINGNWNSNVSVDGKVVWSAEPRPSRQTTSGHNMTSWAWNLNAEIDDGEAGRHIPPTDSRLRPDQRALERGQYRLASSEKERLETAQRGRRKEMEDAKLQYRPQWFELGNEPATGKKEWKYNGRYFKSKEEGIWPDALEDIF